MAIRNPFRTSQNRAQFDAVVAHYHAKGRNLFATTGSGQIVGRAGNSWSAAFWAGIDGMTYGVRVPEKTSLSYPWYAAGLAIRKAEAPVKNGPPANWTRW